MSSSTPAPPAGSDHRVAFDIWAVVLLLVGLLVQVALSFPLHRYPAEADDIVGAIQAIDILHGRFPVFFVEERIGALCSYVIALFFSILGPTRTALALYPVSCGVLTQGLAYGLWREAFPRRTALLALLFTVLPSPSLAFWTYMPTGYSLLPPLCLGVLWSAFRIAHAGPTVRRTLLLGVLAGLAWWHSPQTLMCTGPALLWLLWRRADTRNHRFLLLAGAGALAGAAPWIVYNVVHPLASFHVYGARGASGAAAALANLRYFVFHSLPELVTAHEESLAGQLTDFAGRLLPWLRPAVYVIALAAVVALASRRVRDGTRNAGAPDSPPSPWPLLAGVLVATLLLNVLSEAGERRGFTVRYLLPAQLVLPAVLAGFLAWVASLGRRARGLAVALASIVLIANAAGMHWPGRPTRVAWQRELERAETLRAALEGERVEVVVGEYWETYPVNFWTAGRVLAVPCRYDFTDRQALLPATAGRWALLATQDATLTQWAMHAGISGRRAGPASDPFLVFDATPAADTGNRPLLQRLLSTCGP